jgi:hypothetical protein
VCGRELKGAEDSESERRERKRVSKRAKEGICVKHLR